MALVFLSTLGTNPYQEVTYLPLADEPPTAPTPFVQEARVGALLAMGRRPDRVVVCLTDGADGSYQRNWLRRFMGRNKPPQADGLEQRLTALDGQLELVPLIIPAGATEAELWQILEILDGAIHDKDELVVDITHGFRSQAIVLMTALDYVQRARRVTVSQVSYGAFETRPRESTDPRPTFDLTPFFVLRDWSAASALLDAGDLRALGVALKAPQQALSRLLRQNTPRNVSALPGALQKLGDDLWCSRIRELPRHVPRALEHLANTRQALHTLQRQAVTDSALAPVVGAMQPLLVILDLLRDKLAPLQPADADPPEVFGLLAARFALDHGLVVQGLTLLRESLLDSVVRRLGPAVEDWTRREQDKLLGTLAHQATLAHAGGAAAPPDGGEDDPVVATLREHGARLANPHGIDALKTMAEQVATLRNKLSHAGTSQNIPQTNKIQEAGTAFVQQALAFARAV